MRTTIRRERRVELAFEGKRRWDLVRLKIATQKYAAGLHGMEIKKVGDILHYGVIPAPGGNRAFAAKNYLFPIPQYALDQNSKLTQNPGY